MDELFTCLSAKREVLRLLHSYCCSNTGMRYLPTLHDDPEHAKVMQGEGRMKLKISNDQEQHGRFFAHPTGHR